MVDWQFLAQNFEQVVGTYEGDLLFCECRWVGMVLAGDGDTSTLHVIMEVV